MGGRQHRKEKEWNGQSGRECIRGEGELGD